jgi:A/G-specific adenine glycosylase
MDYGVFLKSEYTNPSRKSAHYTKQSRFEGSDRQIRAAILKCIAERSIIAHEEIFSSVGAEKDRIEKIISQLVHEQFIIHNNDTYSIS